MKLHTQLLIASLTATALAVTAPPAQSIPEGTLCATTQPTGILNVINVQGTRVDLAWYLEPGTLVKLSGKEDLDKDRRVLVEGFVDSLLQSYFKINRTGNWTEGDTLRPIGWIYLSTLKCY